MQVGGVWSGCSPSGSERGLWGQDRARAKKQSTGKGAWSKVHGVGKGVAARTRRHSREGGPLF